MILLEWLSPRIKKTVIGSTQHPSLLMPGMCQPRFGFWLQPIAKEDRFSCSAVKAV
jgi:hypothetical protein